MTRSARHGLNDALPFWISLGVVPLVLLAVAKGGWWWVLVPVYCWYLAAGLDLLIGIDASNRDPDTPDTHLFWHRLITLIWFPVQFALIFGAIWFVAQTDRSIVENLGLFFAIGIASGTIGLVYAHELMHQRPAVERWLGDLLMASVLYSHFRSEHLVVHHAWVGTPRDAVTARYNEGFWRFFLRVLPASLRSAWSAEAARQARAGRPAFSWRNPFWRYAALQGGTLALALALGGWAGLGLFVWQALWAVWQLELTNYIEHYGLTRKYLGDGRYEPVAPRHSWNSAHRVSNWLLINLQRHSDHHIRPDRRFPLLQNRPEDEAPQLPLGYPGLGVVAAIPPLWRRRMNPRVRAWRRRHYPEISDWAPYNRGTLPWPKNAL